MKINFILLKRSLIAVLGMIAVYYLITLSVALISQPSNIENNFSSISNAQYVAPSGVQQSFQPSSTGFDYRVVGYRQAIIKPPYLFRKTIKPMLFSRANSWKTNTS